MTTTAHIATTADLESAIFEAANRRFDGFEISLRYTSPTTVKAASGSTYSDRAIYAKFVDDDPEAGVELTYSHGNGVCIAEMTISTVAHAGCGEHIARMLVALIDMAA